MLKILYPAIEPYQRFYLETGSVHRIYAEQSGNPEGIPVLFLHGGPCSGTKPDHRCFFDPARYRIVLFDQRGCGQSLPFGALDGNTTPDLLDDIERLRQALGVERWLLFGGSWGATLALLYAQRHAERVLGLVLRGVFLARACDLSWFTDQGAGRIYPEQWDKLMAALPQACQHDVIRGIHTVLEGRDDVARLRAAKEWLAWNGQVALGEAFNPDQAYDKPAHVLVQQVRMELHYARHQYFIEENQILRDCPLIQHLPTVIIHGRRDIVCPVEAGYRLHRALPHAEWRVLPDAGHVARGEAMIDALVTATDAFAKRLYGN